MVQGRTLIIFEKEASRAVVALSEAGLPPTDVDYPKSLKAEIRERLAARATLKDLPVKFICPAGHETEWSEVEIIISFDRGATWPLVSLQCPMCLELADVEDDPTQWADYEVAIMGKQLKWIAERVSARLAEIDDLLRSASGSEAKNLHAEKKLIESLRSRVFLGDED